LILVELKSKRVIVTGGCGFIGSHLVDKLVGDGCEVVIIDNLVSGNKANIDGISGDVTFHEASVQDEIEPYMKDADIIFHLAANVFVTKSVEDPRFDADNNIKGILNVLECARKLDISQVVYSSSSAVYGDNVKVPTDEAQPVAPGSPYGISKYVGEMYLKNYAFLYGINSVALRYFNVYGTRQADDSPYSGVIAVFIKNALDGKAFTIFGDGEQSRDFVSVHDVVQANISAASTKDMMGEIFNIGTGRSITLNALAELIEALSGKLGRNYEPARLGDIKTSVADIAKAQDVLDFKPTVKIDDGINDLYEEYRKQN
jgi:UDP-glucose 4-epimerase